MPVYEYKCQKCDKIYESDQTDAVLKCYCVDPPVNLKRLYTFGGAVLKGSGWYSVDQRNKK